jgi:signal transduction histidine kinase
MIWRSLRFRLIAGGIAAIALALALSGVGLTVLFERHIARTMADDLDVYLKQLLANIDVDPQGHLILDQSPADPRFSSPLSGLYWQIASDRGDLLRSRSLWDTTLALPGDEPSPGEVHRHELSGPGNTRVLTAERRVFLTLGSERVPVRVAVAADLARVSTAAAAFAKDLGVALAMLGLVLAAATSVQVVLGLRPLGALRRGIADIRSGRSERLPAAVPAEVKPLVEEVNALLDTQGREIERARGRAADLAHGLKTPLVALTADAGRLRERGEQALAHDIETIASTMVRHVDRELARARLRSATERRIASSTAVAPLVQSIVATLARTPDGSRVQFEQRVREDLKLPLDRADLAEVLGNLLENAARHAKSRVRIIAPADALCPSSIAVEDDGPGISPDARSGVLETGTRLDVRGGGTGLGLAIVQDVLEAYGWRLELGDSDLGGLKASIGARDTPGTGKRPPNGR